MDIYKLKFTRLQQEMLRLLCIKAGTGLSQRTIAKALTVSPTAVGKAIPFLMQEELVVVNKETAMNLHIVSLARNTKTMLYKKLENLRQIYALGLDSYLEEQYPGSTIVLFGSYARGEDIFSSDIDIAIVGASKKNSSLSSFETLLQRTINVQCYDSFQSIHKELQENVCNGIVLAGSIQL